ncbi:MAG: glycosyltransferase family 87 protein [Pyrinomonadaceae bacterium]
MALLLVLRVGVSVCSGAGIGWDFVNYYRTGSRIFNGQKEKLYRESLTVSSSFGLLTSEQVNKKPTVDHQREAGEKIEEDLSGYVGLPISAYVFAPLGAFSPSYALLIFKAQCAVLLADALFILYPAFSNAASGTLRKDLILPLYLVVCLFYEPFWFVFSVGGQATPLNLLLFVLCHRFYVQDRLAWAALFLSLGILIKPFFVLTVLVFIFARDFRFLRNLIVLLTVEIVLSIALLGWPLHLEWLTVMQKVASYSSETWWNNSAIFGSLYNYWCVLQGTGLAPAGEMHGPILGLVVAFKFLLVVMFFRMVQNTKRQNLEPQQQRHHIVSLAILFALLFSNIVWPHYLAFLCVPLFFLLIHSRRLPKFGEILIWLILISTLAVQSRFAQRYVLSMLGDYPLIQASFAGLFGAGTLILTLILLVAYHGKITRSGWEAKLFPRHS